MNGLYDPVEGFYSVIAAMPEEFFTIYNYLIEKGVTHALADEAAHKAWENNFTEQK